VYTNDRVARFINDNFIPVKLHISERRDVFERFGAQWTPTLIILDQDAKERYRFEGFLPADDFLAELHLGLAKVAFAREDYATAEKYFRAIVEYFPNSHVAPEAQYWAGVAKYKASGDASALAETAEAFRKRYSDSSWAKKASVWARAA
jgi:hypothetical protein